MASIASEKGAFDDGGLFGPYCNWVGGLVLAFAADLRGEDRRND